MHFALRTDGLEKAYRRHFAVNSNRNIRAQFALFHQALANSRIDSFEIVDHLAHSCASHFDGRFAACYGLQQRGNIDRRHGQSRCFQMASMMAGGFMGKRSMRTPAA